MRLKKKYNIRKRKRNNFKRSNIVIWRYAPLVALLLGSLVGAVVANMRTLGLEDYIAKYMMYLGVESDKTVGLIEAFIKYGKNILCIWALGFVGVGIYIMPIVLLMRGFSYGFATAVILRTLGLKEGLALILLYLPQSFLLIPLYIIGAWVSVNYIISKGNRTSLDTKLYGVCILPMMVIVFLTSLLEVFVVPLLI